jgi:hypothetical protein
MDSLFSTPLFDMFRRGEVAQDLRLLAAQGVLAPRAHEQLALLVFLTNDGDSTVRQAALQTIDRIPAVALSRFLGRAEVSEDVRAYFAARGILPVETADADDVAEVEPFLSDHGGNAAEAAQEDALEDEPVVDDLAADDPESNAERRRQATVQRLAMLNVTEKVKAAMRGTREERGILIRDPNKLVSVAVLSSPKLSEQEVENFARMGSVSEESLRVIGTTRAWIKNYGIVKALCFNPKTPVGLSLGFVKRLLERDIKHVVTDRNLPEPLKIAAKKIMQAGQSRRG